jgi:Zn-dependent protease
MYNVPRNHSGIRNLFRFSEKEMRHLGISLLIIAALPIMSWRFLRQSPTLALGAVLIFAAAFLLHELAHKFMAQRLGYWAEFRLNNIGLLITLMSFFSNFKIVAPGAVMIAGLMHGDDYGKISVAGPVTNIAQAILFLALDLFTTNPGVSVLAYVGVLINSSLALFNLLPFGVFDGAKILRWDWRAWLATAATAGLLYFYIL